MNMDLVDSVLPLAAVVPAPVDNEETKAAAAVADDDHNAMDDESMQVRTMEVPRWLSTLEVTKYLVGNGKGKALEEEYESTIVITGEGSGTKDPSVPGFGLPHLLCTMSGTDVRQLGRLRRALEDSLIQYVIEHTPEQEDSANPPPSLGRLLYNLGLTAANASPKTKDRAPDRTVLARSHFPVHLHRKRKNDGSDVGHGDNPRSLLTKKVWMNVLELPQDPNTGEYHGRFLASKSFMNYYRTHFHCRVDIYGVWGNKNAGGGGGGGGDGDDDNGDDDEDDDPTETLMCAPYVLITSDEKANVDRCIQYVEHRIRDHEEKFDVSRAGGRRILRGEKRES